MSTAINENNVLHAIYGGKTFLKVKVAPEIEKINIDFVEKGNAKEGKIQLYMDMIEFGSDLIRLIRTGRFEKALFAEKQKAAQEGRKYPNAIYHSPMGGFRSGDKTYSRFFTISPGESQELVFTAYLYPAETSKKGAYIPVKGAKPTKVIRVGATLKDMYALEYTWSFFEKDYMSRKFSLERMSENDFFKKKVKNAEESVDVSSQNKETEETHASSTLLKRATLELISNDITEVTNGYSWNCIAKLNNAKLTVNCYLSGNDSSLCEKAFQNEDFKELVAHSKNGEKVSFTASLIKRVNSGKTEYLLEEII